MGGYFSKGYCYTSLTLKVEVDYERGEFWTKIHWCINDIVKWKKGYEYVAKEEPCPSKCFNILCLNLMHFQTVLRAPCYLLIMARAFHIGAHFTEVVNGCMWG